MIITKPPPPAATATMGIPLEEELADTIVEAGACGLIVTGDWVGVNGSMKTGTKQVRF